MRYTPTLKLSTRLTAFVTVIVISAMFILFIGGTLSFKRVGQDYLNGYLDGIVRVIDKEMSDPKASQNMHSWLPKLLQASNIAEMELSSPAGTIYGYKDTSLQIDKNRLFEKSYVLSNNSEYVLSVKAVPLYLDSGYSLSALSSITLAIGLVIFCLIQGVRWLKVQLRGSELLEERGRMILAGRVDDYAKGDHQEWPYTASEALDSLIEELQDARQERSRFDTFIRTHTFLDQLTGAANRVLFDSKLEAALQESDSTGGVLLIRVSDWDSVFEANNKSASDEFIVEVGGVISNIVQRFPEVVFARYYDSDFAVLIPNQTSKDVTVVANQCIRQLERITPLEPLESDNWFHIGMTFYSQGEPIGRILGEVETALKSAQLQSVNTWSRFQKQINPNDTRGSVRWRALFDKSFTPEDVLVYEQPCYLINGATNEAKLLHNELFVRLNDEGVGVLKASRFMAAIEQVGYEAQMDRVVLGTVIRFIKASSLQQNYSVNLNVVPFKNKLHVRWLRDELLQMTTAKRHQLSFEFVEGAVVTNLDFVRPVIKMISGLGCSVIIGQAGKTIASTHYIKDLNVDYLKLHRSLVKKIEQRQENQLFIRSLVGACEGTDTRVIAVGVETGKEWKSLVELGVDGGQGRMFQSETQIIPKPKAPLVQIGKRNRWRKKY